MGKKIVQAIADKILKEFDTSETLQESEIQLLIEGFKEIVSELPNCERIKSGKMFIAGDIHGDFRIMKRIATLFLESNGVEHLVFLGDIVDRGSKSIACLNLLFALKIKYPNKVHVIRGNHESLTVNSRYGFLEEIERAYGNSELYNQFNISFGEMPIALVHERLKIFFVHGGIPINLLTLKEINKLPKGDLKVTDPIILQLLWNDPDENIETFGYSMRGLNIYTFGGELVSEFLEKNNLKMIVRAHEAFPDGFRFFFKGRLLSLFSSEEYYSYVQAKVALIDENGEIEVFHPMEREGLDQKTSQN